MAEKRKPEDMASREKRNKGTASTECSQGLSPETKSKDPKMGSYTSKRHSTTVSTYAKETEPIHKCTPELAMTDKRRGQSRVTPTTPVPHAISPSRQRNISSEAFQTENKNEAIARIADDNMIRGTNTSEETLLKSTTDRVARLEENLALLKVEMIRIETRSIEKDTATYEKVIDQEIKNMWDRTHYNIRCVTHLLKKCNSFKKRKPLLEVLGERLPGVSMEEVPKELRDDLMGWFVMAYIWRFVYDEIFSGRGCVWQGDSMQLFQQLKRSLVRGIGKICGENPHYRDFPNVCFTASEPDAANRAKCASFLSNAADNPMLQPNRSEHDMITQITNELFSTLEEEPDQQARRLIEQVLTQIVLNGILLAKLFMSSRPLLVPDWPLRGSKFRTWQLGEFEKLRIQRQTPRRIVVKPALEKFGNAAGENLDQSILLCQPAVVFF